MGSLHVVSAVRLSWQAALYDWIRVVEDRVLVVLKKTDMNRLANAPSEQAARSMFDFVVVGYDMLKDLHEVLEAMEFKVIILDESHCIKNHTVSDVRGPGCSKWCRSAASGCTAGLSAAHGVEHILSQPPAGQDRVGL